MFIRVFGKYGKGILALFGAGRTMEEYLERCGIESRYPEVFLQLPPEELHIVICCKKAAEVAR